MSSQPGSLRSSAARIVDRTLRSRRPLVWQLQEVGNELDPRDRALLHELVQGTLRWLRRLDSVIVTASHRQLHAIDPPLRSPLRIAVYQLLFLDRIPAHAAVNEAVSEARRRTHRGGASFVNAVLRRVAASPRLADWPVDEDDPGLRLAIETSHPDLLVQRWRRAFGEARTRDLLQANNLVKPMQLLTFSGHGGRDRTASGLKAEGVETRPSEVSPMGLVVTEGNPIETDAFQEGRIYLQDVASQAAALVPLPRDGERLVDLAAAPGGKSFSLLSCQPSLQVLAAERSWRRLKILVENRRRLGLSLSLIQADSQRPPLTASFDRVVLDVPCTGTGTLRKNPELKWRIDLEEIERLADQGLRLLQAGSRLVRRGGILILMSCSLEPEENSGVMDRFLATTTEFEPLPLAEDLPEPLVTWVVGPGAWQILPADVHDGFSVHVLRRRG